VTAVRVIAENVAEPLDWSRPARPLEMLAAAFGADHLPVWLGPRRRRRPSVTWAGSEATDCLRSGTAAGGASIANSS
jgi:hypothetical protein